MTRAMSKGSARRLKAAPNRPAIQKPATVATLVVDAWSAMGTQQAAGRTTARQNPALLKRVNVGV